MSKNKRYNKVSQMARGISEDKAVADAIEKRIAERQIVKHLMSKRAALGLSQADIAAKMNCSQSRISKLENGLDDDIRLGDFHAYISALDRDMQIHLLKKDSTIADQVKHHFFAMKALMEKLAGLATADSAIAKGVAAFFGEAAFNLIKMLIDSVQQLPDHVQENLPFKMVVEDEDLIKQSDCEKPHCSVNGNGQHPALSKN